jgi:hypothetical protein
MRRQVSFHLRADLDITGMQRRTNGTPTRTQQKSIAGLTANVKYVSLSIRRLTDELSISVLMTHSARAETFVGLLDP